MSRDETQVTGLTVEQFVEQWEGRQLSERESAQAHFIQLCRVLGVDAPYDNRANDESYRFDAITAAAGSRAYEDAKRAGRGPKVDRHTPGLFGGEAPKAAPAREGVSEAPLTRIVSAPTKGHGFADVWKRGCFCWEYKRQGQHADLGAALEQLKRYRDSLENPPLLIVCDVDRFEIHTNFTGFPPQSYGFGLRELIEPDAMWRERYGVTPLNLLRMAFDEREANAWFKPERSLTAITEAFAERVARLARDLDAAKTEDGEPVSRHEVAHFLMQLVFSLFAEDVGLLPRDLVTRLIQQGNQDPKLFTRKIRALFKAMETGAEFGADTIDWFNGGLFKGVETQRIPRLTAGQLGLFVTGEDKDWSAMEPSILGTLFERALDPEKRSQIGAHYTSRDDIMLIIEPVVMRPLVREWEAAQREALRLAEKRDRAKTKETKASAQKEVERAVRSFHDRLASVSVLDPACGSGNFLYVAIQSLLDLEKKVLGFAALREIGVALKPKVKPTQLHGIEINEYAAELARVSIWIGFLKWKKENASYDKTRPILHPLETIECRDAILDQSNPKKPKAAKWEKADFIVGNPPFLGSKLFRKAGLTEDYLRELFAAYDIPKTCDLCCYWFEQARQSVSSRSGTRVGLLATQAIRSGDNRVVLQRIKQTGDVFMAWSDREWLLDGAAVHVSLVGFDSGAETERYLDGRSVVAVHANLSTGTDTTTAHRLPENARIAFMGDTKGGKFEVGWREAARMLGSVNSDASKNLSVVRPWSVGLDITRRNRGMFIVDFGLDLDVTQAAGFEAPFSHVEAVVKAKRLGNRRSAYAERWWLHVEPRPALRAAIAPLKRFVATPNLTKHRLFSWFSAPTLPDHQLIVFARADDYFLGVLHSAVHEVWARGTGSQLRESESGFRYTPTSTFETYALPWVPGGEPVGERAKQHDLWRAIFEAARELDDRRSGWLNPPEWITQVDRQVDLAFREELSALPSDVRSLVRRSAVMAEATKHPQLKVRTLTNLYNERPAWLRMAHEKLDRAVIAAYSAVDPKGKWDPEWARAYEPFGAGEIVVVEKGKRKDPPEVAARKRVAIAERERVDALILGNLLRLNKERAGKA